jgi:hypothetical protein
MVLWTEAQIASWQEHFQNLLQLGSAAIPAIHQFLQQNIDLDFGSGGKQILGTHRPDGDSRRVGTIAEPMP